MLAQLLPHTRTQQEVLQLLNVLVLIHNQLMLPMNSIAVHRVSTRLPPVDAVDDFLHVVNRNHALPTRCLICAFALANPRPYVANKALAGRLFRLWARANSCWTWG